MLGSPGERSASTREWNSELTGQRHNWRPAPASLCGHRALAASRHLAPVSLGKCLSWRAKAICVLPLLYIWCVTYSNTVGLQSVLKFFLFLLTYVSSLPYISLKRFLDSFIFSTSLRMIISKNIADKKNLGIIKNQQHCLFHLSRMDCPQVKFGMKVCLFSPCKCWFFVFFVLFACFQNAIDTKSQTYVW